MLLSKYDNHFIEILQILQLNHIKNISMKNIELMKNISGVWNIHKKIRIFPLIQNLKQIKTVEDKKYQPCSSQNNKSKTCPKSSPRCSYEQKLDKYNKFSVQSQQKQTQRLQFVGVASCHLVEKTKIKIGPLLNAQKYDLIYQYIQTVKQIGPKSGEIMESKKQYLYRVHGNQQEKVDKLFKDGSLFQQIWVNQIAKKNQQTKTQRMFTYHNCKQDHYFGKYAINAQKQQYSLIYRVYGPNKNYQISNDYAKIQ